MSTIKLTFWVFGDDCDRTNVVEIALDKNVAELKEMIKEKKKPALDHLSADALDLWMVSVLFDDDFKENLNALNLKTERRLSGWRTLASLFSHKSADDCLDIVVKVPDVSVHSKPVPLLTLNCLMRGDDLNRIFPVEISASRTVGTLKEMIKDKKKPALDHLPADALDLWKVSIPIDNAFKENLESHDFAHGTLLPHMELSTLFLEAPAKGYLHVVVKAPFPLGEPDMTHPAEKAHNKVIKDAEAAAAPSSVSTSAPLFKLQQEKYPVYNGRPNNRRGPPLAIYHTAFAQLKDALQDVNKVVDLHGMKRVDDTAKLSMASTQIYRTEKERIDSIKPHIHNLLGIELRENVASTTGGKKKAESDALVEQALDDKTFGKTVAIVSHVEVKNELGVAGQSGLQNTLGLRKFLVNDNYKNIRNTTCCPCITISIAGPYIMFGGAIYADIFVSEAFTDFIYIGGTNEQIVTLSRIFAAVARAIETLKGYYRCLKLNLGSPNVNRLFPQPTYRTNGHPQEMPTILRRFDYEGRKSDNYRRSLFEATYKGHSVLIKFCQAYHGGAHRIAAEANYAPKLFFCERLQGGVMMVMMELVDCRDAFHHFSGTETIPSDLLDDVRAAIVILHDANLVFGDLRRPNILVKKTDNDRLRALLIDFEWAGEADQARYPPFLNDTGEIDWAEGVRPYATMMKQHDLDMINLLNHSVMVIT